jgi:3-oxoacyl-[acyl-carrier protein] reductase
VQGELMGELQGRIAIVTGGSRGIGAAVVETLLREGATVHYLSRTPAADHAELEQRAAANGAAVHWRQTDVTDEAATVAAIDGVLDAHGRIDLLVNNAGITRDGLVMRMRREAWDAVLLSNLTATFVTSRQVARTMLRARSGAIINVSSVSGLRGNPGQTNYAASKAGIIGFSKSLAREVGGRGVRVNVVAPGYIDTDMTRSMPDQARSAVLEMIPLKRTGTAMDVAELICFLASERASYITGQVIQVDGGLAI